MYNPQIPPQDSNELLTYLNEEFQRVAVGINGPVDGIIYKVWYQQPPRPRTGMTVYADGTSWNPGAGEGIYRYNLAGAWVFIG